LVKKAKSKSKKKKSTKLQTLDILRDALIIPRKIETLKAILDLDLTHIRGIDFETATVLRKVLKAHTIRDLSKSKINEEQFLMLKLLGISPSDLNIWLFISKTLKKGKIEEIFGPKKISLVGLDNAGKTAILHVLQNKLNVDIFSKLKPTFGVNREIVEKFGFTYNILDMGGQARYRSDYIQNAERYFIKIGLLIFVIDVQDSDRYEEALDYFNEILRILELLKENPEILIMIHKVDPDIKDNEELIESIQFLEAKIKEIFQDRDFQYEIVHYSIFNALSDNKTVVTNIRDFLSTSSDKYQELKDFVTDSLERMMNIVITLSSSIEQRFSKIEAQIGYLREWNTFQTVQAPVAKPVITEQSAFSKSFTKLKETESLKTSLRDELKSLLKMRKVD